MATEQSRSTFASATSRQVGGWGGGGARVCGVVVVVCVGGEGGGGALVDVAATLSAQLAGCTLAPPALATTSVCLSWQEFLPAGVMCAGKDPEEFTG